MRWKLATIPSSTGNYKTKFNYFILHSPLPVCVFSIIYYFLLPFFCFVLLKSISICGCHFHLEICQTSFTLGRYVQNKKILFLQEWRKKNIYTFKAIYVCKCIYIKKQIISFTFIEMNSTEWQAFTHLTNVNLRSNKCRRWDYSKSGSLWESNGSLRSLRYFLLY